MIATRGEMYLKINKLLSALCLCLLAGALMIGCSKKTDDVTELPPPPISLPPESPDEDAPAIEFMPTEPTPTPSPEPDGIPDPGEEVAPEKMSYDKDYKDYVKMNSETVGWISVPNTRIEYPVMQAEDNNFYLTHKPDKKYSKSGSVFMDYRNVDKDSQRHTIIYGHNMRNGTMFHDLTSYKVKDFFEKANTLTLYRNGEKEIYDIYAAFIVTADIKFIKTNFKDDEEFVDYMKNLQGLSKFKPKKAVEIKADSQIVTLSTCTYEYDNSRYVVQAIKR